MIFVQSICNCDRRTRYDFGMKLQFPGVAKAPLRHLRVKTAFSWPALILIATLPRVSSRANADEYTASQHYPILDSAAAAAIDLGKSVFETQWTSASAPRIDARVGLGPMFNAASCNTCHFQGGHGEGPISDGPTPVALVIQLESPGKDGKLLPAGDPTYGRVFTTSAIAGVMREGSVAVKYSEVRGYYYPFGPQWTMRIPHYSLVDLNYGPLAPGTVIKPRLAPPLYGIVQLEAVPEDAIAHLTSVRTGAARYGAPVWQMREGKRVLGRFGWQGDAVSIRDQTVLALVHEIGLTSHDRSVDDCTTAEVECRNLRGDAAPEISDAFVDALVAYQRTLTVPKTAEQRDRNTLGASLFAEIGCAACHRPRLPVRTPGNDESAPLGDIAAYTDLRLHNLGVEMADENAAGEKVTSRWRTAPLWGLNYRMKTEINPTFMHDGRARSTEEAVLWHSGEASSARFRFEKLGPNARDALLRWIEAL
jgi:CxxC motif-containing protein (DUF1111 family)